MRIFDVTISFGHNISKNFYVTELKKKEIEKAFEESEKITIDFWREELKINMEFVQYINFRQLSQREIEKLENTDIFKNLLTYEASYKARNVE